MGILKTKSDICKININNTEKMIEFTYKIDQTKLLFLFLFLFIMPFFNYFVWEYNFSNSFSEFINYIIIPQNYFLYLKMFRFSGFVNQIIFLSFYFFVIFYSLINILCFVKERSIKINKISKEYIINKGFMGKNIKKNNFSNFSIKFEEKIIKRKSRAFSILFISDNKEIHSIFLKNIYYSYDLKDSILKKRIVFLLKQFRELLNKEIEELSTKIKPNIFLLNELNND